MNIDPLALAEPLGRGHLGTHYLELCRGAVLLVCEQLESIELQHVLEIASANDSRCNLGIVHPSLIP